MWTHTFASSVCRASRRACVLPKSRRAPCHDPGGKQQVCKKLLPPCHAALPLFDTAPLSSPRGCVLPAGPLPSARRCWPQTEGLASGPGTLPGPFLQHHRCLARHAEPLGTLRADIHPATAAPSPSPTTKGRCTLKSTP